jgi:hypothetical protein
MSVLSQKNIASLAAVHVDQHQEKGEAALVVLLRVPYLLSITNSNTAER